MFDYVLIIVVLLYNGKLEVEMIKIFEFLEVYEMESGFYNFVNVVIKYGE